MPLIYSVSRLRKEVGSSSPLRRKMMENTEIAQSSSPRVNSATATEEGSPQIQSAPAVGQVKSRRGSTLNPESIELPPSSSATGPSSSSSSSANSSPMARQSSLPQTFPSLNYDINEKNVGNDKQSKIDLKEESSSRRHDRNKSRSRDKAFEEGILKEMRERLAAAGLGG